MPDAYLRKFESVAVEGVLQQLLDGGQNQAVVLVQKDLVAVALLHLSSCGAAEQEQATEVPSSAYILQI